MDANMALKDAENALRDFIEEILSEKLGQSWLDKCGVTPERIEKWKERKEEEQKKLAAGNIEPRLLYYADFYDLETILSKHWSLFSPCFGDWKTMEVYLGKMGDFRNPDAHRRQLLPAQEQLLCGISGEIRNAITNYRSKRALADEFFPRIEYVQDSLGNVCKGSGGIVNTGRTLRPGDKVTFTVTAWDPLGEPLEYQGCVRVAFRIAAWSLSNVMEWVVSESDIGRTAVVSIEIRSSRQYHASLNSDDQASLMYAVVPRPSQASVDKAST